MAECIFLYFLVIFGTYYDRATLQVTKLEHSLTEVLVTQWLVQVSFILLQLCVVNFVAIFLEHFFSQ